MYLRVQWILEVRSTAVWIKESRLQLSAPNEIQGYKCSTWSAVRAVVSRRLHVASAPVWLRVHSRTTANLSQIHHILVQFLHRTLIDHLYCLLYRLHCTSCSTVNWPSVYIEILKTCPEYCIEKKTQIFMFHILILNK